MKGLYYEKFNGDIVKIVNIFASGISSIRKGKDMAFYTIITITKFNNLNVAMNQ